jgi:hypothetical protein
MPILPAVKATEPTGVTSRFLVSVSWGVGFRWFAARHARRWDSPATPTACPTAGWRWSRRGRTSGPALLEERLRAGPAHARVEAVEREDQIAAAVPPGSFDIR